jgi:hypothetical protein
MQCTCKNETFTHLLMVIVVTVRWLDLQLPVPITTKLVSSNPAHGEVYSIRHYVIKLVSDLRQVGGFLRVLRCSLQVKWSVPEEEPVQQ